MQNLGNQGVGHLHVKHICINTYIIHIGIYIISNNHGLVPGLNSPCVAHGHMLTDPWRFTQFEAQSWTWQKVLRCIGDERAEKRKQLEAPLVQATFHYSKWGMEHYNCRSKKRQCFQSLGLEILSWILERLFKVVDIIYSEKKHIFLNIILTAVRWYSTEVIPLKLNPLY